MSEPVYHELASGQLVRFVPREQLRTTGLKRARYPLLPDPDFSQKVEAVPEDIDWSKKRTIDFPMLGNDQYGDCYYVAPAHQVQLWNGNNGKTWTPNERELIRRYLQLSGGDNGLSDSQVFPELRGGIIGPNGPHKWLDIMTINPANSALVRLCLFRYGGLLYTASLLTGWLDKTRPGDTWDAGDGFANPNYGHAMLLSGMSPDDVFRNETWAISPAINLTTRGMLASDPEIIVGVSLDWYDERGYSPAGYHYTDDAKLWQDMGGKPLPASPFPPPAPPSPPVPPAPPPSPGGNFWDDLEAAIEAAKNGDWAGFISALMRAFRDVFHSRKTHAYAARLNWFLLAKHCVQLLMDVYNKNISRIPEDLQLILQDLGISI